MNVNGLHRPQVLPLPLNAMAINGLVARIIRSQAARREMSRVHASHVPCASGCKKGAQLPRNRARCAYGMAFCFSCDGVMLLSYGWSVFIVVGTCQTYRRPSHRYPLPPRAAFAAGRLARNSRRQQLAPRPPRLGHPKQTAHPARSETPLLSRRRNRWRPRRQRRRPAQHWHPRRSGHACAALKTGRAIPL